MAPISTYSFSFRYVVTYLPSPSIWLMRTRFMLTEKLFLRLQLQQSQPRLLTNETLEFIKQYEDDDLCSMARSVFLWTDFSTVKFQKFRIAALRGIFFNLFISDGFFFIFHFYDSRYILIFVFSHWYLGKFFKLGKRGKSLLLFFFLVIEATSI